jgi:hypothetical protein
LDRTTGEDTEEGDVDDEVEDVDIDGDIDGTSLDAGIAVTGALLAPLLLPAAAVAFPLSLLFKTSFLNLSSIACFSPRSIDGLTGIG